MIFTHSQNQPDREFYFSSKTIGSITALCVFPFILNQFGIDFGSSNLPFDPSLQPTGPGALTDALHKSLSGSFTHTILEWSAFCTAIFIVFFSYVHFNIRKDVTTPLIGVALFFAGSMDAFHTLAADRLIEAIADNQNLIPFTWAICRIFNILIMISGVTILLLNKKQDSSESQAGLKFIILTSLIFGGVAFGIIHYCATSAGLPQTIFPDAFITRPWDIGPLVLYIIAGLFVFPRLFRMEKTYITSALVISVIPHTATQVYMAFGSTALFDNNFNIAHFLKILGYFIPFFGFSLEYLEIFRKEELTVKTLKATQEKLEKANRKTQLILDSAGDGIYGLDLDGNTTFVNSAAEKILGYKEAELLGKLQHSLIHHSKPDGTHYPREDCRIYAALRDGKVHRESEEVFWRKEGTPVPIEYVSTPIRENGKLTGAVVTFKDISERKRVERMINEHTKDLKKANEMLFRSNKELDDFAYIVSHDLKEPLRGIYNYSGFIKEDYFDKLDKEGQSKLDTLERLSKRMELLINTILYYARLGRSEAKIAPIDLNKVVANTLENMQPLLEESQVDVRMSDHFPTIYGDEIRIGEVFQNLIANAIKYNDKPDKWIEIGCIWNGNENGRTAFTEPDSEKSPDDPSASPVFYVKDNGIGILEKHFDSLFRIFKRLNGKNKFSGGTGAGTTIVKKIIEQHKGRIWLESKVGEGTTFYFTLGGEIRNEKYQSPSFDSNR